MYPVYIELPESVSTVMEKDLPDSAQARMYVIAAFNKAVCEMYGVRLGTPKWDELRIIPLEKKALVRS